jgi:hypothetical protein
LPEYPAVGLFGMILYWISDIIIISVKQEEELVNGIRKMVVIILVLFPILISGCAAAIKNQPPDRVLDVRITPNPEERRAFLDIITDQYPERYPKYNAFETIENKYYSLSLPNGWRLEGESIWPKIYNGQNEIVGEIYTQSVDENINPLPNHAGLLESSEININGILMTSLIYDADYPAASGIERIDIKQGICFKTEGDGCFLTFYKAYLDKNAMHYLMTSKTVIQIAKTFVIKK